MDTFYTILLETIKLGLAGVIGGLIGARANDRMARRREFDRDIKAYKLEILPILHRFIEQSLYHPAPITVHRECVSAIKDLYLRFRIHLDGDRHLASIDAAWRKLEETTEPELVGNSKTGVFGDKKSQEFKKIQDMLTSRLAAFYDSIDDT